MPHFHIAKGEEIGGIGIRDDDLLEEFDLGEVQFTPDGAVDFRVYIRPAAALVERRKASLDGIRYALRAVHLYRVPLAHPVRRAVSGASEEGLEGGGSHLRQPKVDRGGFQIPPRDRNRVLTRPEAGCRRHGPTLIRARFGGDEVVVICDARCDDDVVSTCFDHVQRISHDR